MNFQDRGGHSCDGIRNGYRCMCISSGIDEYGIKVKSNFMDFIDDFSFNIALKIIELQTRKLGFQCLKIIFKRSTAINFRFSFSQEIEIWAVEDEDFQCDCRLVVLKDQSYRLKSDYTDFWGLNFFVYNLCYFCV